MKLAPWTSCITIDYMSISDNSLTLPCATFVSLYCFTKIIFLGQQVVLNKNKILCYFSSPHFLKYLLLFTHLIIYLWFTPHICKSYMTKSSMFEAPGDYLILIKTPKNKSHSKIQPFYVHHLRDQW